VALLITFTILVPAGLIAVPAALAGATFPFAQRLVSDDFGAVGRRYGALTAANIAGSILGGVLVSYVALEHLGSAGTYALLGATAATVGLAGLWRAGDRVTSRPGMRRGVRVGAAALVAAVALVAIPSNGSLMATLHGASSDDVIVEEDRSCASVAKLDGTATELHINGSSQNGYPFDDFHVLIGLLPSLAHDDPRRGLAVGLGIGSTSYGMLLDDRLDSVETVELCGGIRRIIDRLAAPGRPELQRLTRDPRLHLRTADGRRHLAETDRRYDVITADTLRPQAANSGSLYSVEFFTLARDRLTDDGLFATWVPTGRALSSVASVFPHVIALRVDAYFGSVFVLASTSPIELDGDRLAAAVDQLDPSAMDPAQRASLARFLSSVETMCITDGNVATPREESMVNRDLRPRDEYFLNNPAVAVDPVAASTC
jgi:spermidine synthase